MADVDAIDRLWAVIPAGGAGTRLWPLSRASAPKFLLDLTGAGRTLIQQTLDRLEPLVAERVVVVTGQAHAAAVGEQLGLGADSLVAEPSARDSMAAIGLAAAILERRDPDALLGSFAADHVITDGEAFRGCVAEAAAVADTGAIVTIGIEPTFPSTAFGYIQQGEPLVGFASARSVRSFVEKPDAERAAAYVASGKYRWNGGMFVARADVLLDELALEHPEFAATLRTIAAEPERLEELWPELPKIAIDHAVAEPAAERGKVATVPGKFGWDDVGDFASLAEMLDGGPDAVKVIGSADGVIAVDSSGLVVSGDRPIAVVGLRDVVVVDTGDAVLVTDLAHAQQVKRIVEELKKSANPGLLGLV